MSFQLVAAATACETHAFVNPLDRSSCILALPLEIRRMIYSYMVKDYQGPSLACRRFTLPPDHECIGANFHPRDINRIHRIVIVYRSMKDASRVESICMASLDPPEVGNVVQRTGQLPHGHAILNAIHVGREFYFQSRTLIQQEAPGSDRLVVTATFNIEGQENQEVIDGRWDERNNTLLITFPNRFCYIGFDAPEIEEPLIWCPFPDRLHFVTGVSPNCFVCVHDQAIIRWEMVHDDARRKPTLFCQGSFVGSASSTSLDQTHLYTVDSQGCLTVRALSDGHCENTVLLGAPCRAISVNAYGLLAALGPKSCTVWELGCRRRVFTITPDFRADETGFRALFTENALGIITQVNGRPHNIMIYDLKPAQMEPPRRVAPLLSSPPAAAAAAAK